MNLKSGKIKPRPLSILSFAGNGDAYSKTLFRALRSAGSEVAEGVFSWRWLAARHRDFDCVHLNWPSFLYADRSAGRARALKKFASFILLILLLKLRGLPVYWTAHNLYPHEPSVLPVLDRWARRFVVAISRRIFVHGPTAAGILAEEFPAAGRKSVVIDHGNWIGLYPGVCSKAEARQGIWAAPDQFVFLFVGLCREYKNLHGLLEAFEKIEGNAKLVIAGLFLNDTYYHKIRVLAERHPPGRVLLRPGFVPDEELQHLVAAADTVVLPYSEILTSGAAVLALSLGRPVVAPRKGYLVDLVPDDCGVLYTSEKGETLVSAMREAMNRHFDENRIVCRALQLDWGETAKRMVDVMGGRSF